MSAKRRSNTVGMHPYTPPLLMIAYDQMADDRYSVGKKYVIRGQITTLMRSGSIQKKFPVQLVMLSFLVIYDPCGRVIKAVDSGPFTGQQNW